MSQVPYGIMRICRVGFPQISARQLADVCEPFAKSSQVICGNIAGYSQYVRTVPAECSCWRVDCTKEIYTAIYTRFTHNPRGWPANYVGEMAKQWNDRWFRDSAIQCQISELKSDLIDQRCPPVAGATALVRRCRSSQKTIFVDSIICGLPKILLRTLIRRFCGCPKDDSMDSWQTICGTA